MDPAVEMLFSYLRDVIYDPKNAVLNIEKLPEGFQEFGAGLHYFAECALETKELARALSKGDLAGKLPSRGNEIAAPLKSLHASLKHLTWQAQQIAQGSYQQRVEFMGEFSSAFNTMIEQLAERQQALEDQIRQIQKQTTSLEQGNLLLNALMRQVPLQIIVIDRGTQEILFMNEIAISEVNNDDAYVKKLMKILSVNKYLERGCEIEIEYPQDDFVRYFVVKSYLLEWHNASAEVFVISDSSAMHSKIKALEMEAYHDSVTQLYNRAYGMLTLGSWLHEKRQFVLIFADLDRLKYINDEFGHKEGDMYIIKAAKHLKTFSSDALVCRIGGDEFMLLASNVCYDEAHTAMTQIYHNFQNDEYLEDKTYSYSISFGIIDVEKENKLSASDILSIADERMYENKKMRKMSRQK